MLDLRKRIILNFSLLVALIVLIFLVYYLVFKKKDETNLSNNPINNLPEQNVSGENNISNGDLNLDIQINPNVPSYTNQDEIYVKQLAAIFVERYRSFSNQNKNIHLETITSMATPEFANWLSGQLIKQSSTYYGIISKVLSTGMTEFREDYALVSLNLQETIESNGQKDVQYKVAKVELKKISTDWKISSIKFE